MASEIKTDKMGGQYRVTGGKEEVALWLPLTVAEKEAVVKKAMEKNVPVVEVLTNALRGWLQGKELSLDQLEKVAGGAGAGQLQGNMQQIKGQMQSNTAAFEKAMEKFSQMETVMCPW